MLKGLDPILSPDLLWALAAMGHGDDLALVDGNHPAQTIAKHTVFGRPILLSGVPVERAARAILSLLPLDAAVPDPARRMEVIGDAAALPPVQQAVQTELDRADGETPPLQGLERFAFYAAAKQAFAVVRVADPRPYGCFLFRKGVIAGDVP